jgi:hypothetical protein
MRSLKKYIGVVIFILVNCSVFAQKEGVSWQKLNESSNRLQGKLTGRVYYISGEANRSFLYPNDWVKGDILLTNGDKFENQELRYEADKDELIVYNANNFTLFFVEKEFVKSFTFKTGEKIQKFVKLSNVRDSARDNYFEELYSGKRTFLAFHYIFEHKVSPFVDRNGVMRDSEYLHQTNYFMYSEKEGIKKMDINRRSFFNAFPEKKKEIKKLFRKNHLLIQHEEAMIFAFRLLEENNIIN